jgi:hypothetical protein
VKELQHRFKADNRYAKNESLPPYAFVDDLYLSPAAYSRLRCPSASNL